jgi:predicted aspartyl protease
MPDYRIPPWSGPAAPLVDLSISWNGRSDQVLAILDTGADQTQIPNHVVRAIQLRKVSDKPVTDANGREEWQPVYVANLSFDGSAFDRHVVVGTPLAIALIGRDILNRVAILDGPRLSYSLTA